MAKVEIKGGELQGLEKLIQQLATRRGLRVGILEGATNSVTGEKIAPYAAANEFGAPGIPSRPFMRSTIAIKSGTWAKGFARMLQAGRPAEQALELLGNRMAEDVQETIKSNMPPPNSPATRERKNAHGAGKGTLIDTGSMLRAVDYEVK